MSDLTCRTLADLKPVWLMDPKEVDSDTHEDFYRHVSGAFDKPRFVHHFRYAFFFDHSSTWLKKAGGCYETSALSSHFSKNLGIFEHLEVVLVNIQDQCFTYSYALKN